MTDARASFAIDSRAYAAERPHYPPALFGWMAHACTDHRLAWDCATGNGQAALGLAPYFRRVEATDLSEEQVAQAFEAPNIRYSARPAEASGFADASFDLVAVAQALHWFDLERFWDEVRRVAKPGAFFCAWGYSWFARDPDTADLHRLYIEPLSELLRPYWAPNNRILWNGYRSDDIAFPFRRVEAPPFAVAVRWPIDRLIGFVRTWSATKGALRDPATAEALLELEAEARAGLVARGAMALSMPIALAAGRIA